MSLLILGLVLFLGVHSVSIVAPAWRDRQVAVREGAFKGIYSLVSLAGFIALLYGYGMARMNPVVLYSPPAGLRHLALLLMVPVFPLFISTYLPGRISRAVKHPTLLAVKFWATAHLLANGTLHDVILFGAFLVWAIADRIAVKRRAVPHKIPGAPPSGRNDVIAVVLGLLIYVAFVWRVHLWVIGVSPLG